MNAPCTTVRVRKSFAFTQRQDFEALHDPLTNQQYVATLLGRYQPRRITTEDPNQPEGATQVMLATSWLKRSGRTR